MFKVVKNRLAKRAADGAGTEGLDELLVGPTALTLINGDAVIAAKAISNFSREHGVLVYKGGFMDGEALDPEGFTAIARLPGVDVLHGQLVGLAASPLTGLVARALEHDLRPRAPAGPDRRAGPRERRAAGRRGGAAEAEESPRRSRPRSPKPRRRRAEEPAAEAEEPRGRGREAPADEPPRGEARNFRDENEQGDEPSSDESEDQE